MICPSTAIQMLAWLVLMRFGVTSPSHTKPNPACHAAPGRTATVEPEEEPPPPPPPAKDDARDLLPEDLVLKDSPQRKPKRPRNKRHGRR